MKPFQFFNYMLAIEGFQEEVRKAWDDTCTGDPITILGKKMKATKLALVALNKKHGNLQSNVTEARGFLDTIESALVEDHSNFELLQQENVAANHLESCLKTEEDLLHQKSRIKWLDQGDGNNKFFFNQSKMNWNTNKILAINNDSEEMVFCQNDVANVAVDYFAASLGKKTTFQHAISNLFPVQN